VSVNVEDRGNYKLFETAHGNRILMRNGERWVEGQRGEGFQELILPTEHDNQVVSTDAIVGKGELRERLG
jgi:hypothetical protein